jgi:nucleoside 2-deoxyribosyltransferase
MMHRLKNQRVYLAGPMDRCPNNGQTWRDTLTPILSGLDLKVLNPISKPINIAKEDSDNRKYKQKLKELKNYDALSSLMKEIRSVDLRMVDISDFIIVNVDLEIFPCGTMEEIFLANRQKKPIIVHMQQGKENAPDWLFGTLPHQLIFSNWFEIVDYLKHIDSDTNIECYKRWYFFDI